MSRYLAATLRSEATFDQAAHVTAVAFWRKCDTLPMWRSESALRNAAHTRALHNVKSAAKRIDRCNAPPAAAPSLHIAFAESVDPEWIMLFKQADSPVSMEEPAVVGNTALAVTASTSNLEEQVSALVARVQATNEAFQEEIVPRKEREAAEKKARYEDQKKQETDVREQLDKLWEGESPGIV